jgi:hypothetical protein
MTFDYISLIALENENCFRQTLQTIIKRHILCSITCFPKIVLLMRKCGENMVEADRATDRQLNTKLKTCNLTAR